VLVFGLCGWLWLVLGGVGGFFLFFVGLVFFEGFCLGWVFFSFLGGVGFFLFFLLVFFLGVVWGCVFFVCSFFFSFGGGLFVWGVFFFEPFSLFPSRGPSFFPTVAWGGFPTSPVSVPFERISSRPSIILYQMRTFSNRSGSFGVENSLASLPVAYAE